MIDKIELKGLLMEYILEFVDISDKKLVRIFDETFCKLGLKGV